MLLDDNMNRETQEVFKLSDKEIFTQIWFSPRKVFRYLEDASYDKYIHLLIPIFGISYSGRIFMGIISGYIIAYIYSALLSFTGSWIGGGASRSSILRAFAYAIIPYCCIFVVLAFQRILLEPALLNLSQKVLDTPVWTVIFLFMDIATIILALWSFVLLVIALAELQKIPLGSALVHTFIPLIPLFFISLIAGGFMALGGGFSYSG